MPDVTLKGIPFETIAALRVHAHEQRDKWEESRRFRSSKGGRDEDEASEMVRVWNSILAQLGDQPYGG